MATKKNKKVDFTKKLEKKLNTVKISAAKANDFALNAIPPRFRETLVPRLT